MEYRRVHIPGGTYFFTLVTYNRRPLFSAPEAVDLLRNAFRYTLDRLPFSVIASVVLPDHMHFIWTLPPETSDYSTRWKMIKTYFTKKWPLDSSSSQNLSGRQKGEQDILQRRFWEHWIRDEKDLKRHIDYVHYNPVKHGLVNSSLDWKYTSLHQFIREGLLPPDWDSTALIWPGDLLME